MNVVNGETEALKRPDLSTDSGSWQIWGVKWHSALYHNEHKRDAPTRTLRGMEADHIFLLSSKSSHWHLFLFFCLSFKVGSHIAQVGLKSHCVAEVDPKFLILQAFTLPKCWEYRCELPCLVDVWRDGSGAWASCMLNVSCWLSYSPSSSSDVWKYWETWQDGPTGKHASWYHDSLSLVSHHLNDRRSEMIPSRCPLTSISAHRDMHTQTCTHRHAHTRHNK